MYKMYKNAALVRQCTVMGCVSQWCQRSSAGGKKL